ncbi:hypothetical protein BH10PAT1_BH10PAT1_7680 [soil metagenome]
MKEHEPIPVQRPLPYPVGPNTVPPEQKPLPIEVPQNPEHKTKQPRGMSPITYSAEKYNN